MPLPTNQIWWGSMQAISSYRGNRPTNKQTNTQTDRGDYNTLRFVWCVRVCRCVCILCAYVFLWALLPEIKRFIDSFIHSFIDSLIEIQTCAIYTLYRPPILITLGLIIIINTIKLSHYFCPEHSRSQRLWISVDGTV